MIFCALTLGCNHAGHNHADHEAETAEGHEGHNHAGHEGHNHAAEVAETKAAEEQHAIDEIIFPAEQARRAGLETEEAARGDFRSVIRCSGEVLGASGDRVTLSATVSGIVSRGEVTLSEGAAVGAGRAIFYISSKGLAQGDQVAKAHNAYLKAKADRDRAEGLIADRIISDREWQEIDLAYKQAKTEYDVVAGADSGRGMKISSPISGYLTEMNVGAGDYVEVGQPLGVVSQNRRLVLRAEVSQRYAAQLRGVTGARFTSADGSETFSLDKMGGRLLSTGTPSASTGYMTPVTFEFNATGGVVPGSLVEVYLLGAPRSGVISVPNTALTEQQGVVYVYVRLDEEGYEKREVRLGSGDGLRTEILAGLEPGENVVVKGAAQVKMASASGEIPHGHSH